MKKERKLTEAELKRKAAFDEVCNKMEQMGYVRHDLTVDVVMANVMAILVTLPFVAAAGWYYYAVNSEASGSFSAYTGILFFFILFLCTFVHEVIHALTWGAFAKSHFKSISFGVIWKLLTPYCTCSEPLKKWQYILGGAMPTLILGFGLAAIATIVGQWWLFGLSELMILGGGGDFLIILKMLFYRPKNKTVWYFDHPYECGLVAFEKEN